MKTQKKKSKIAELRKKLERKNISKNEHWKLRAEFCDCFDEMSNVQRVALLKRFWRMKCEVTIIDQSTNCFYSSSPLFRAFTISHEHLIRRYQIERGESLDSSKKVAGAADKLKHEIAASIRQYRGEVRADGKPFLKYEEKTEPQWSFYGFQPGLASDDFVIGMFFSEADRQKAIQDVVMKLGDWGVRTEPLAEDRDVHSERHWFWKERFDRKQFRKDFRKLSHEERLDAIDDLDSKGVNFMFTDADTGYGYQSSFGCQGSTRNTRSFSYYFDVGYIPENGSRFDLPDNFPSANERRKEIDEIERTLLHLIAKHGGFVTGIERHVDDAVSSLEESEEFLGYGKIEARFPNYQARRNASSEIHERLAIAGVHFSVDKDEQLSIDEQIAKTNWELDQKRKDLDRKWSYLDRKKRDLEEDAIRVEEDEQELLEEEESFKEFAKSISDRLQRLSQQRESLSDASGQ